MRQSRKPTGFGLGFSLKDPAAVLEGCEAAVLSLEVGQFTTEVPMSAVIRLKDAE